MPAARRNGRGGLRRLPAWHGRHATQLSLPEEFKLLGGNCVHYTATMCQNELPVNVNPEPCQDVEAKLSCKMRQDGLKDCCCLTYDKL